MTNKVYSKRTFKEHNIIINKYMLEGSYTPYMVLKIIL